MVIENNLNVIHTLYKKIKQFLKDLKSKTSANIDFVVIKAIAYNKRFKKYKLGNMIFEILIIYFNILRLIKICLDKIYCYYESNELLTNYVK